MNRENFYIYLNNPDSINNDSVKELESIVIEYPWFQTGHVLYLKSLYKTGHLKFGKQLRKSAGIINDRKLLYNFINSPVPEYKFEEYGASLKDIPEIKVDKPEKKKFKSIKEKEAVDEKTLPVISIKEEIPEIVIVQTHLKGQVLIEKVSFDINKNYTFEQWLKITSQNVLNQIDRAQENNIDNISETENQVDISTPPSENDLVNRFIELNPRLETITGTNYTAKDISASSVADDDSFVTETLAEIYIKQKHYERAIHAYKKLSLKYPEKYIYFANQIEKILKLNNE